MKVYIVISFNENNLVRIEKVFSKLEDAQERVTKLELRQNNSKKTYHILTKTVNGLLDYGIPSKGKIKVVKMDMDLFKIKTKVWNQKDYIKKLEKKIQDLKLELVCLQEQNNNIDLNYESQANDNYGNTVIKQQNGHVYLANGDVWENSDFDEYRPNGNFNIQY